MEFNQVITVHLHSLFTEHGFIMVDQSRNEVIYELSELQISLVHDPNEGSNTLWIGRKNVDLVEIDNHLMRTHFKSDLQLSDLSQEAFVNSVLLFFMSDGNEILSGNRNALIGLEKFNERRSQGYTMSLVEKQSLEAARKAWSSGNYAEVIRCLDMIDGLDLPASFRQKYKIARQRLRKLP